MRDTVPYILEDGSWQHIFRFDSFWTKKMWTVFGLVRLKVNAYTQPCRWVRAKNNNTRHIKFSLPWNVWFSTTIWSGYWAHNQATFKY